MPDFSIIIVTYNSSQYILSCLESIYGQEIKDTYEVIIYDNNSTDFTPKIIRDRFKDVIVIESKKNIGFAAANNEAVKISNSGVLFFLNPDTKLCDGSLDELFEAVQMHKNEKAVIFPAQYDYDTSEWLNCGVGLDIFGFPVDSRISKRIFYADAAAMLIKKDNFSNLGMFDEALFLIGEDVDLSWKAHLLGFKLIPLDNVKILHKSGGSIGCGSRAGSYITTNLLRRYYGERNILRNLLKNYTWRNLFWILPFSSKKAPPLSRPLNVRAIALPSERE